MIKLYYFSHNFGDELSPYIVKKLSNQDVKFYNPLSFHRLLKNTFIYIRLKLSRKPCDTEKLFSFSLKSIIFAIGSIIESSNNRCIVWGSGLAQEKIKIKGGNFLITRGYLSRIKVQNDGYKITSNICGDPAILLPLIYKPSKKLIRHKIGLIPHYSEYIFFHESLKLEKNEDIYIINLKTKDVETVIDEINSCDCIFSSSLHGLIVSHAYGIPAIWITQTNLIGGKFKFYDYFSSVGIKEYSPIVFSECLKNHFDFELKKHADITTISTEKMKSIQKELLLLAPFKLIPYYEQYAKN